MVHKVLSLCFWWWCVRFNHGHREGKNLTSSPAAHILGMMILISPVSHKHTHDDEVMCVSGLFQLHPHAVLCISLNPVGLAWVSEVCKVINILWRTISCSVEMAYLVCSLIWIHLCCCYDQRQIRELPSQDTPRFLGTTYLCIGQGCIRRTSDEWSRNDVNSLQSSCLQLYNNNSWPRNMKHGFRVLGFCPELSLLCVLCHMFLCPYGFPPASQKHTHRLISLF